MKKVHFLVSYLISPKSGIFGFGNQTYKADRMPDAKTIREIEADLLISMDNVLEVRIIAVSQLSAPEE